MSRTRHHGKNRERQIRVRGVRRRPVDMRRLARVLIDLAQAEAEKEAQAQHGRSTKRKPSNESADGASTKRPGGAA